jgi:hypothetical protein
MLGGVTVEQSDQSDYFSNGPQGDMFGPPPRVSYAPKPEKVRLELAALLDEMRAANAMPWTEKDFRFYKKIFPQMTNWLPKDEAAKLRFQFETELARLLAEE